MKHSLLIAVGIAILLGLSITFQPLKAQVYGEYDTVKVVLNTFQYITNPTIIAANSFLKAPRPWSNPTNDPNKIDRNNGYYLINDIGFDFEFNGEKYKQVWICINGFLTFSEPPAVAANISDGLFLFGTSFPNNVIAPYWGNHYYITISDNVGLPTDNLFLPSEISWKTETLPNGFRVFTVQWKNLNINNQQINPIVKPTLRQSIGNFQVKLYESTDDYSREGNIEFCYDVVGGNLNTQETVIITRDASVGVKGDNNVRGGYADFLNGLINDKDWMTFDDKDYDPVEARTSVKLTNDWQPSGGTDKRIRFNAAGRKQKEEWWGDGDVDLSQLEGGAHDGMGQNRFVTVNDVRLIMRSIATNRPLDSIRRRNAYHGDVNHNGRYFYRDIDSIDPVTGEYILIKTDIPWRNKYYGDSLEYIIDENGDIIPSGISSIKRVFYQITEYDASWILHYLGGRLDSLPWLLDTFPLYGKISAYEEKASNIVLGEAESVDAGVFRVPVYLNGYINGPVSVKFDVDGEILNASVVSTDGKLLVDFENGKVVIAGAGEFDSEKPICYVTIRTANNSITLSNIRFNDRNVGKFTIDITSVENITEANNIMVNGKNPFSTETTITLNIEESGNYTLVIYDAMGIKVKTLLNKYLEAGQYYFDWNGTDERGNKLSSGVYINKLTGDNVSISKKLMLTR